MSLFRGRDQVQVQYSERINPPTVFSAHVFCSSNKNFKGVTVTVTMIKNTEYGMPVIRSAERSFFISGGRNVTHDGAPLFGSTTTRETVF